MNSRMQETLLRTLDSISARDEVSTEVTSLEKPGYTPGKDYDVDTGEWLGEPPEGYKSVVEAPEIVVKDKETKVQPSENSDASDDYQQVRNTTYALQEATLFMIGQVTKLAVATEAPRVFSVFRELGELMRGFNKDLMENQKAFKAVTKDEMPPQDTEVQVSVDGESGTTNVKVKRNSRDLLKAIEEAQKISDQRARERALEREAAEAVEAEIVEDEDDDFDKEENSGGE